MSSQTQNLLDQAISQYQERERRRLTHRVDRLEEKRIVDGALLEDLQITAGDNKLIHRLGRLPRGWIPIGYESDFGSSIVSFYPDILAHKRWESNNQHSSDTTANYTMGFTPTDGKRLIAVVTHAYNFVTVSSISQSGVSWANVASVTPSGCLCELWIGTSVSSASTSLSVTFDTSSSVDSSICIMEIDEIDSDTFRNSASGTLNVTGSHFDCQDFLTEPVPEGGDICIAVVTAELGTTRSPPTGTGWRMIGYTHTANVGSTFGAAVFEKVAQSADAQPFMGHSTDNGSYGLIMANIASSLAQPKVTVPHGLTQVQADKQTITLNAVAAATTNLWVF